MRGFAKIRLFYLSLFYLSLFSLAVMLPETALAQGVEMSGPNTAWIMTATALVLFMTIPGLALFYGGLVRSKNVLSVLMHCFSIACVASLIWLAVGYSIAFGEANVWWGGLSKMFLAGAGEDGLTGDLPTNVHFAFQMTFAIITPALIVGAYVERIKFSAVLLFSGLWLIFVYALSTHWIWGGGFLSDLGWLSDSLKGIGTNDFAGGLVVHANAGVAALVIAMVLGRRHGFPDDLKPPHNPGMVMIGAAMLWVGWFGFNGGSELAANGSAGMAITVTQISASTACLVWIAIEWIRFGKPSLVGIATGAIAGLATITPGSGSVGPVGALVFGALAAIICYFTIDVVKRKWKIDDSLDVFAVHGIGGVLGILLTGIFAAPRFGGMGLPEGATIATSFSVQLIAAIITVAWAAVATYIIVKVVQAVVGLRVSEDEESEGLDIAYHGETGYDL